MEARKMSFKYGHLRDAVSQARIAFHEGDEYILIGNSIIDLVNVPEREPETNPVQKRRQAIEDHAPNYLKLLVSAGESLFGDFKIKIGENKIDVFFHIIILEDLYLYRCSDWKQSKRKELATCLCTVDQAWLGQLYSIPLPFTKLYANSLSEAYRKAHDELGGSNRFPTTNVHSKIQYRGNTLDRLGELLEEHKIL